MQKFVWLWVCVCLYECVCVYLCDVYLNKWLCQSSYVTVKDLRHSLHSERKQFTLSSQILHFSFIYLYTNVVVSLSLIFNKRCRALITYAKSINFLNFILSPTFFYTHLSKKWLHIAFLSTETAISTSSTAIMIFSQYRNTLIKIQIPINTSTEHL